ncbi:MAG: thiamine ABC transporter substrate binding subunit [Candidatus Promineifilaceae bacterium]
MKRILILVFLVMLLSICLSGCGQQEPVTLRLMTHDSFDIAAETMAQFTEETGIAVEVFKAGDAGAMVNQAVLAAGDPLADVLFGIDNTFLSRALNNKIFIPYESPVLDQIRDDLKLDPQNRALPVDFGDVCLNYDRNWFAKNSLDPPRSLDDLIDPAYAGLTVVENAATSSPGLAFLLATIDTYGEMGYLDYWQKLEGNDVLVTDGWEDAYYGAFSASSDGSRPVVVSYASSPAAEVFFAETALDEAPTAAVVSDGSCFRQVEFVGILQGTKHETEARQLVDFLLSRPFQEDIPLHMFVYPANEEAQLPEVFIEHSQVPQYPATISPEEIAANREAWVQAWTETVLR